jgi:carbon-monoxide dehydrogenase medium subunit
VLAEVGPRDKVLAGGQSLVPLLNMRLAAPAHLVDVNWLAELDEVATDAAAVRVGALARQARVEHDADAAAADFFVGPLKSARRPGELATAKRSSP